MTVKKLSIVDGLSYKYCHDNNGISYYCGGDFSGTLLDSNRFEKDFAIALAECDYSIEELMLLSIGKFYVKKTVGRIVQYYSSIADYGLYYSSIDEDIFITRRAKDLGLPINKEKVVYAVKAHHLVGRSHFGNEIFLGAQRVLPGCCLTIDKADIRQYTYLVLKHREEGKNIELKYLNSLIRRVIDSYKLTNKDCLLFSGGIDSSVLASILVESNSKCEIVNFRYDSLESDDSMIVKRFKEVYIKNLNYKGLGLMSYPEVKKIMKKDFGTIVGPQYFKDRRIGKRRLITGQNLDTLMHIDTYAPGSAYQGIVGILMNIMFFFKRLYISDRLLNNKFIKSIAFPLVTNLNGKEFALIDELYSIMDEHTAVTVNLVSKIKTKTPNTFISSFLKESWSHYRGNEPFDFYLLLKVSRFYKTCYNVNANYELIMEKNGDSERLTPYTEGPIAHYLLSTRLPAIQLLLPKKVMYDIFQSNVGKSYKYFTEKTSKSKLVPYIYNRFFKKFSSRSLVDQQDLIDTMLENLINDLPVKCQEFQAIYKRFIDRNSPLSKAEYLQLCRSINMNYFLLEYDSYTNRS